MSNDLVPAQQHPVAPFGPQRSAVSASVNHGAVSIEVERAIAEAQGQMTLAKRFPRDLNAAHAEMMIACKSASFAAEAFYAKPQGGSTVTGPSIRMAEQLAQVFGNFQYGHRELSRDDLKSEVEVYAWDMEKNNYNKQQKTIMHVRDTRDGPKKLRDQADIDQKINNIASKEKRGLIIAMMPKWLVADAINECKKTIAGTNDEPLEVRVRKMTQAFLKFGVKTEHLEKYLQHPLKDVLLDELVDLTGIYNLLKDGTPASEIFGEDAFAAEPADKQTSKGLAEAAQAGTEAKAKADAKPAKGKPAAAAAAAAVAEAKEAAEKAAVPAASVDKGDAASPASTSVKENGAENDQSNAAQSENASSPDPDLAPTPTQAAAPAPGGAPVPDLF